MVKKWLLVGGMLLLVSLLVIGCGIPQEEYDVVMAERDTLQREVTSLQSNLDTAENQIGTLESEVAEAQSQIEALGSNLDEAESQIETLQSDYDKLKNDYETVSSELADIKMVYPPRDFSSRMELEDWLLTNDVSEKPITSTAEGWIARALEVQEDALADGYVVSMDYDGPDEEDKYYVFCTTIIDGYIWVWDPEADEVWQDYNIPPVK